MNTEEKKGLVACIGYLIALAAIAFAAASCVPAIAQTELILGGWSYHLDREKNYNEVHNNIGVKANGYTLMYYKNSGGHDTIAFGKDILPWRIAGQNVGFTPVLLTGYLDGGEPAPMVFATMTGQIYGNLGYEFHTAGVVSQVSFTYRLSDEGPDWRPSGDSDFALGYGYGLLGGTYSSYYRMTDNLTLRANYTTSQHAWDDRWDHWPDNVWLWQQEKVVPEFYGLNLDYAPLSGNFIIYAGIQYNGTEYHTTYHAYKDDDDGPMCGAVNVVHEGVTVCHGDKLYGDVDFDRLSGAFGLRYGNPFADSGWGWYVDFGVKTLHGIDGVATYDGRGDITQDQLTAFEDKERAKYSKYDLVPNGELGLYYRF